jgi:hypothetical protein
VSAAQLSAPICLLAALHQLHLELSCFIVQQHAFFVPRQHAGQLATGTGTRLIDCRNWLCCVRSAVIASGEADEVRASLQGLERELASVTGGGSISEPLFQLMCHGVPSRVKAAVDRYAT